MLLLTAHIGGYVLGGCQQCGWLVGITTRVGHTRYLN